MNQILTTKPVKTGKSVKIKTIKIFFGISVIIFGLGLITSGSFAMVANKNTHTVAKSSSNTTTDTDTYTNTSIDHTTNAEIQISFSIDGSNIRAKVVGETEISFVTYKWDDEEEKRQDINSVSDEIIIEIPEGQHTLTVTAVDINNNTQTKEQQVKGIVGSNEENNDNNENNNTTTNESAENTTSTGEATQSSKPKLEVKHDKERGEFVINSSDEKGLDKFEFILNGQGYLVRVEGEKEKQFRYPLVEGENTLEVTAYNVDGQTETFRALIRN